MPILFNTETGVAENVPEDQAEEAYLSGRYGVSQDSFANVFDPETQKTYKIPAARIEQYLGSGFKFESDEQKLERSIKNDPANTGVRGALKTFAGQAFNQALLGVPRIVDEKIGTPEEDKKAEITNRVLTENNPVSNIAGGITGFGASLLYGGPIWKGAGLVGQGAERLATKALMAGGETLAKNAVGKIATQAAKLAAENVAINLPARLTEAALGDPETAAQGLAAGMMQDVGMGAAFGAGTSVASKILPFAGKALAGRVTPEALESEAKQYKLKNFGWLTSEQKKLQEVFGTNNQKDAVKMASEWIDEQLPSKWDQLGGSDKLLEKVYANREQIGKTMNAIRDKGDELLPNGAVSYKSIVGNLDELIKKAEELPTQNAASIQDLIKAKKIITENAEQKIKGFTPFTGGDELAVVGSNLDSAIGPVGAAPGSQVVDVNFTFKESQDLKKLLGKEFWPQANLPQPLRQVTSEGGHNAYNVVRDSIHNAMYQVADAQGGKGLAEALKQANKEWAQTQRILKPVLEKAAIRDAARSNISLTDIGAAAAGAAADGGAGILRGMALNVFRKVYGNFVASEGLGYAAKVLQKVTDNVDNSIAGFLSASTAKNAEKLQLGSIGALSRFLGDDDSSDDKVSNFIKVRDQLDAIQASPEKLGDTVNSMIGDMAEITPNLYPLMVANMHNITEYLTAQAPRSVGLEDPLRPNSWVPTDRDISGFERKLDAVMNPMKILDEVKTGTLTKESVQAVQTVYPQLYSAIQRKIIEQLSTLDPKQKMKVRTKLRLLLTDPKSGQLESQRVGILQSGFDQNNNNVKPKANSKITIGQASSTDIDRVSFE